MSPKLLYPKPNFSDPPEADSKRVYVVVNESLKRAAKAVRDLLTKVSDLAHLLSLPHDCLVRFKSRTYATRAAIGLRDLRLQNYHGTQLPDSDKTFQESITDDNVGVLVDSEMFLLNENDFNLLLNELAAAQKNQICILNRRIKHLAKAYLKIFDQHNVKEIDAMPDHPHEYRSTYQHKLANIMEAVHRQMQEFLRLLTVYATEKKPCVTNEVSHPHHILIENIGEKIVFRIDGDKINLNSAKKSALLALYRLDLKGIDVQKFYETYWSDTSRKLEKLGCNFANSFRQTINALKEILPRMEIVNIGSGKRAIFGLEIDCKLKTSEIEDVLYDHKLQ